MNFSELQLYCLGKMGIDLYLSRESLQAFEQQPVDVSPEPQTPVKETTEEVSPIDNLLQQVREKVEARQVITETSVDLADSSSELLDPVATQHPEFNLVVYRCDRLLLIDSRATAEPPGVEYRRFVNDVLFACKLSPLAEPEVFQWPLTNNPAIDKDEQAARESLALWLSSRFNPGQQKILLLGESARAFCQFDSAAPYHYYSVADIFKKPLLKADLWQLLQDMLDLRSQ